MTLGLNVQVITAETARGTYRRRVITRHTSAPGIGVLGGIPYNNIKTGTWDNPEQRQKFVDILQDFESNPNYGKIDITQVSAGATVNDCHEKAADFEQRYGVPVHLQVVDYLALLATERQGANRREEITEILQQYKQLCITHDNGRGFVGFVPHQMKQDRREAVKPEDGKFYTVRDFADTSEAGKIIDFGIALYRDDELIKVHELAASILKNRDGECPPDVFRLFENYGVSYIGDLGEASA
jgi:hypothetical protein